MTVKLQIHPNDESYRFLYTQTDASSKRGCVHQIETESDTQAPVQIVTNNTEPTTRKRGRLRTATKTKKESDIEKEQPTVNRGCIAKTIDEHK